MNSRLVGAMLATHRKAIYKKMQKIEDSCNGVMVLLSPIQFEKYSILEEDLRALYGWIIQESHEEAKNSRYDLIRAMYLHGGLTFPSTKLLDFFDRLLLLRVILFEKVRGSAVLLPKLTSFIWRLFSGSFSVRSAIELNLISPVYDKEFLRNENISERKSLARKRMQDEENNDEGITEFLEYKATNEGVNALAGVFTRYTRSCCRTMTKTVNLVAKDMQFQNESFTSKKGGGLENVALRPYIAVRSNALKKGADFDSEHVHEIE